MEPFVVTLGWIGLYAPLALGAVGSMVGCSRAGQAAAGALLETESGHGRYIGVSAMPSRAPMTRPAAAARTVTPARMAARSRSAMSVPRCPS